MLFFNYKNTLSALKTTNKQTHNETGMVWFSTPFGTYRSNLSVFASGGPQKSLTLGEKKERKG